MLAIKGILIGYFDVNGCSVCFSMNDTEIATLNDGRRYVSVVNRESEVDFAYPICCPRKLETARRGGRFAGGKL